MTGIGTDITSVERVEHSLARFGERFLERVLSRREREHAPTGKGLAAFLAGRWAAKEAFAKALGTGFSQGVYPREIEVLRLPSGAPRIEVQGQAKRELSARSAGRIHVSISHDHGFAVAFVVIE